MLTLFVDARESNCKKNKVGTNAENEITSQLAF